MATWTNIPNASLEPGAPARSADMIALRDNDVYLKSVLSGTEALKIPNAALVPPSAGYNFLVARIFEGEKIMSASSWPGGLNVELMGHKDQSDVQVNALILVSGVVRLYCEASRVMAGGTIYLRIHKNGVLAYEAILTTEEYVPYIVDIGVGVGDIISWSTRSYTNFRYGKLRRCRIYSNNNNFAAV